MRTEGFFCNFLLLNVDISDIITLKNNFNAKEDIKLCLMEIVLGRKREFLK